MLTSGGQNDLVIPPKPEVWGLYRNHFVRPEMSRSVLSRPVASCPVPSRPKFPTLQTLCHTTCIKQLQTLCHSTCIKQPPCTPALSNHPAQPPFLQQPLSVYQSLAFGIQQQFFIEYWLIIWAFQQDKLTYILPEILPALSNHPAQPHFLQQPPTPLRSSFLHDKVSIHVLLVYMY